MCGSGMKLAGGRSWCERWGELEFGVWRGGGDGIIGFAQVYGDGIYRNDPRRGNDALGAVHAGALLQESRGGLCTIGPKGERPDYLLISGIEGAFHLVISPHRHEASAKGRHREYTIYRYREVGYSFGSRLSDMRGHEEDNPPT